MGREADTNFLEETLRVLKNNGKNPSDVYWCIFAIEMRNQDTPMELSWDLFKVVANFKYYSDYGTNFIHMGAKIIGHDWWLEREEYDGKEWWAFKTMPTRGKNNISCKGIYLNDNNKYSWYTEFEFRDSGSFVLAIRDIERFVRWIENWKLDDFCGWFYDNNANGHSWHGNLEERDGKYGRKQDIVHSHIEEVMIPALRARFDCLQGIDLRESEVK